MPFSRVHTPVLGGGALVTRMGYGDATLVMLRQLQEATLDERICLFRKRTDQLGLLATKTGVHLAYPRNQPTRRSRRASPQQGGRENGLRKSSQAALKLASAREGLFYHNV